MKAIGYIVSFLTFIVLGSVWGGYVLSVLWDWFIVSHFELKPLTLPVAIGLAMVISYTTHQYDQTESSKDAKDRLIETVTYSFMKPLLTLFAGWIITFFM